jgi:hypothetical protein
MILRQFLHTDPIGSPISLAAEEKQLALWSILWAKQDSNP